MTWPLVQLRRVARFAYGDSLADDSREDGDVPVFGSNGQVGTHSLPNTLGPALVIGRKGSFGKVQYTQEPVFAIDTTFYVDRRLTDAHLRWLYYVLQTMNLDGLSEDVGVPGLSRERAYGQRVPLPASAIQRAIADYLDRETARIDALIVAKQRMVELLDERWQVMMHAAVSGLLGKAPNERRRTAIPWLDDVPGHWGEAHLKLVASLGTGHTPSRSHPEWWTDLTIPWITTGEVAQMRSDRIEYVTDTRERISELGMANSSATLHPAGTVVLCRTASAGYSAIMGKDMATSQDFATWTCGLHLRPRFLLLCLRAMRQDLLGRLAMGSTHQTIYMPDIESIKVPLPPLEEQDSIVEAAYSEQRALDTCSARLVHQIDRLQERRQALITAAVTGQIDIPEAA